MSGLRYPYMCRKPLLFTNGAGTGSNGGWKCVGQGLGSGSLLPASFRVDVLRSQQTHLALAGVIKVRYSR